MPVAETASTLTTYHDYLRATVPKAWNAEAAHIKLIAEHLEAVKRGEIDRLAIHMPPRHSKTESVTIRYGPYQLEREPEENVLITGYNERFARRLGRKARAIARTRMALDSEKSAADEWATLQGGVLMSRGVGSPPTGTGFKLIIIDDPIRRREDAESVTYREKVWDWYTDDLYTRLEPNGALIIVSTLWHHDDVSARAVASEPGRWTVLKLPALAEENDPMGRAQGEALWPQRYDVQALGRIRDVMRQNEGERSFEALFQQNPTPREGAFFKVSKLDVVDAVPAKLQVVRAWDVGATAGGGDYSVGVKMGSDGAGSFFVLDVVRGQWSTDERDAMIRQTAALDGVNCKIRLPQDPGAAGKSQAAAFTRLLAGFAVKVLPVSGDKITRADPFSSQVNAGNVKLLKGDWNREFIEELRQFPNGKHDDIVDACSDDFDELAKGSGETFSGSYDSRMNGRARR
jgi:predicted phage terminase large subunit-like protein